MILKKFKVTKLLLLDYKTTFQTCFYQKRKDWETEDRAILETIIQQTVFLLGLYTSSSNSKYNMI